MTEAYGWFKLQQKETTLKEVLLSPGRGREERGGEWE